MFEMFYGAWNDLPFVLQSIVVISGILVGALCVFFAKITYKSCQDDFIYQEYKLPWRQD